MLARKVECGHKNWLKNSSSNFLLTIQFFTAIKSPNYGRQIDEKENLSTKWDKKFDELIITAQFSFIRRDSAVDFRQSSVMLRAIDARITVSMSFHWMPEKS
jgi:hypothetical protein